MHLKLFVAVTDRGLFQLKHSNSQSYHGHTWYQFTQKDIKQEHQAASRAASVLISSESSCSSSASTL